MQTDWMCGEADLSNGGATNPGVTSDIPKPPPRVQVPSTALVPPPRELWNPPETAWTSLVRDPKSTLHDVPLSDLSN
jgi:hypothetical protein